MAHRKIAISLPPEIVAQADRMARARRTSRSRLIADLVARAAGDARDRAITEQLNRVYADPKARREQRKLTQERYAGEVFGDDTPW